MYLKSVCNCEASVFRICVQYVGVPFVAVARARFDKWARIQEDFFRFEIKIMSTRELYTKVRVIELCYEYCNVKDIKWHLSFSIYSYELQKAVF